MSDTNSLDDLDIKVADHQLFSAKSGSVNQNADDAFCIIPEEEEEEKDKNDTSQVVFSSSELKLSLDGVGEEGKDDDTTKEPEKEKDPLFPPEKENDLLFPPEKKENEMSSTASQKPSVLVQKELVKEETNDGQIFVTPVLEPKNVHLNDLKTESIELYDTPPTEQISAIPKKKDDVLTEKKETDSPPVEPLINLAPEAEIILEEKEEPSTWKQEKELCLQATIEERKKKGRYTELSSIKTWPDFYNKNINVGPEPAEAEFSEISSKVSIWQGDITSLLIDAIVNAANEKLLGGSGVDGAIHSAAGYLLKEECYKFGGRSPGESVITGGYDLPARYVIHTVGPRGEKPDKLKNCYLSSLQLLIDENQRSIAFPCISTGIFGYPNDKAAEVVLKTVREWLEENHEKVDRVIFCLFLKKDVNFYMEKMQQYFPMLGGHTELPADVAAASAPAEVRGGQAVPENVARGKTSFTSEKEEDIPKFDSHPERAYSHSIDSGGETKSLISTDQNGSFWANFLCSKCMRS